MRNAKSKVRCVKMALSKCADGVCRTHSPIQQAYAEKLEKEDYVKEFRCNVPLPDLSLGDDGKYTTDFLITKSDGDIAVRECVPRAHITRPLQIKMLDASLDYWRRRGVTDWGIVVEKEKQNDENK